jgi:hypothetical protein
MTPFSSVAMLEKLALLKIALCNAPASSSASSARLRAVTSSMARTSSSPWWPAWSLRALSSIARRPMAGNGVLQLEVVEHRAGGDDVLEQPAQGGDVPLAVAQLVDEAALGLAGETWNVW